ncbi:hypothetical protein AAG570_001559 [Ranatra chinensis]|uniref:Uncharacterized protein n=1 Tax=Ranatra chinensis TaxID=642074 RepID=A0ABD0Y955_9HEMI
MSEGLQDIQSQKGGKLHLPFSVVSCVMFHKNKTQETTEKGVVGQQGVKTTGGSGSVPGRRVLGCDQRGVICPRAAARNSGRLRENTCCNAFLDGVGVDRRHPRRRWYNRLPRSEAPAD